MRARDSVRGCAWRPASLRSVAVLIVLSLAMDGCKRSDTTTATSNVTTDAFTNLPGIRKTPGLRVLGKPGNKFEVEYSNRTAVVDMATVARTLRGGTADHRIFLFEDSAQLRAKLVPGNFVLFEGLDLRKVDAYAVDPQTKYLVVGTDKAPLTQALKNADIQINTPVNFDQLFAQSPSSSASLNRGWSFMHQLSGVWDWIQPTAYAGISNTDLEGQVKFSDSNFAEWTLYYHASRGPGNGEMGPGLDLDIRLTREAAGLDASIHMNAHITNFQVVGGILMANGEMKKEHYQNVGLHGGATFDWQISTSETKTPMNEVRFKLPFKIAFPLIEFTGLPMSLEFGSAVLFHPAFTTKGQVAHGTFDVSFSGKEGFNLEGSDMEVDGKADASLAMKQGTAFSPLAAFGLVIAAAFPRVELAFGMESLFEAMHVPISATVAETLGDLLVNSPIAGQFLKKFGNPLKADAAAYFQVVWSTTAAHSGMQSLVPCQQFTYGTKGQVGYDVDIMGIEKTSVLDVFSDQKVKRQPDVKICLGGENS